MFHLIDSSSGLNVAGHHRRLIGTEQALLPYFFLLSLWNPIPFRIDSFSGLGTSTASIQVQQIVLSRIPLSNILTGHEPQILKVVFDRVYSHPGMEYLTKAIKYFGKVRDGEPTTPGYPCTITNELLLIVKQAGSIFSVRSPPLRSDCLI